MKKWERFERLTAALHAYEMYGATVTWDDEINGEQVDVSVRFRQGSYSFLQIIECRDKGRRTPKHEIAAFSVKVEETKAHKGVFVSAAGFQRGALRLAAEKNIDVFTLKEIPEDWPAQVVATLPISRIIGIRRLRVRIKGTADALEPYAGMSNVQFSRISFISPRGRRVSVHAAMQSTIPADWAQRVGPWEMHIDLTGGEWTLPVGDTMIPVDAFRVLVETLPLPTTIVAKLPPEQRPSKLAFQNVSDGTTTIVLDRDLPFGLTTEVEPGHFYQDISGRQYFCESRNGNLLTCVLLASPQHGRRFFASFSATHEQMKGRYVAVTAPEDLERLRTAYDEWREAKRSGRLTSNFIADPENGALYFRLEDFEAKTPERH